MANKEKDNSAAKAGVVGAVIGALAGIVAGVFALAPKGAKENRKDVKTAAMKYKNEAEEKLADVRDELTVQSDEMKAKAKELKGKAKIEVNDLRKKLDDMTAKVSKAIDTDDVEVADSVGDAAKKLLATVANKLK